MAYHRRPPYADKKASDGFTTEGWRKVSKDGFVRFAGDKHFHRELVNYRGLWVYVALNEGWGQSVEVFLQEPWSGKSVIAKPLQESGPGL